MSKSYKRWSKKEKLTIVEAAEEEVVVSACRKHEELFSRKKTQQFRILEQDLITVLFFWFLL